MTTVPEEAVKAALDTWLDHEFDGTLNYPRMRNALTAALPHLLGVGVKKLEWREDKYPKSYTSGIGPLTYSVFWDDEAEWSDIPEPYDLILGEDDGDTLGSFETADAAKAAAQADYEARIMSAIEVSAPETGITVTDKSRFDNAARNLIINQTSTNLENIINGNDPEVGNLNNDVWDRLDKMALAIEARILSALEPTAARELALEEAARVAEAMDGIYDSKVGSYAAVAIRALSSPDHADAGKVEGDGLPQDVINLVIAAREVWEEADTLSYYHSDEEFSQRVKALDKALEAFAERVPYENEPSASASEGAE